MFSKDTIISTITSSMGGSVCLFRISGEKSINIAQQFFIPQDLKKEKGGTFHFGKIINKDKEIIDEVIIYLFRKPRSYTGEDVVEISCHNNVLIIDEIFDLFIKSGCRLAQPGEFTKRAFFNGKMDLTQAEAVADIISSKTKQSLKNSINILGGILSIKINELKQSLIDIASLLELEIDFSEEDLDIIPEKKYLTVVDYSIKKVEELIRSFSKGRQFQKGIEVIITGKPNVGKSSLMNSLLGKDRVIVSHIPGTTRDMIHEDIVFEDILVRLIDTAGIRLTFDEIEKEGVKRARKLVESSELILVLIDISEKVDNEDIHIIDELTFNYKNKLLLVANKIDKDKNPAAETYIKNSGLETIYISAREEINIEDLKTKIYNRITSQAELATEEIIISNKRQYEILKKIKMLLQKNRKAFKKNVGHEFIAADLRLTIESLAELTGEITTDDILNNIFSNFCIGK